MLTTAANAILTSLVKKFIAVVVLIRILLVTLKFTDGLTHIHLLSALEGHDKGFGEAVEDGLAQTGNLVVVGRGAIGVLVPFSLLIAVHWGKALEVLVARLDEG